MFGSLLYKSHGLYIPLFLMDFAAYIAESKEIENYYKDRQAWTKSCLINIAKSGYFSSDRTIEQYNKDIWHLKKIEFKD